MADGNGEDRATRERNERIAEFVRSLLGQDAADEIGAAADAAVIPEQPVAAPEPIVTPKPVDHTGHRQRIRDAALFDDDMARFDDVGVLETVLSFSIPRKDTRGIAEALLAKFGSLRGVFHADVDELAAVPSMTHRAAKMITDLNVVYGDLGGADVRLERHTDTVDYFAALHLGSGEPGTYLCLLDENFRQLALEHFYGRAPVDERQVVSAVGRYSARYVIMSTYDGELMPMQFNAVAAARKLKRILSMIDTELIDWLIFSPFGYYSMGDSRVIADMMIYVFMPFSTLMQSREVCERIAERCIAAIDAEKI